MKLKNVSQRLERILGDLNLRKTRSKGITELTDGKIAISVWDHFGEGNASVAVATTTSFEEEVGYWGNLALADYLRRKNGYKLPTIGARFISSVAHENFGEYDVSADKLTIFEKISREYLMLAKNIELIKPSLLDYDTKMKDAFIGQTKLRKELELSEFQQREHSLRIFGILQKDMVKFLNIY